MPERTGPRGLFEAAVRGAQRSVGFLVNGTGHATGGFLFGFLGRDAGPTSGGGPVDRAATL